MQTSLHLIPAHGRRDSAAQGGSDHDLAEAQATLQRRVSQIFRGSFYLRHVDAGSCNACESEIKLLTSPFYDLHRLGIFFTPSPRHADALLVTGPITRAMEGPLQRTLDAIPEPRLVIAVGACACSGGIFSASPNVHGSLADLMPVDILIPGCPPSPFALIHGLLLAIDRAEQRLHGGSWEVAPDLPVARTGSDGPEPGKPEDGR